MTTYHIERYAKNIPPGLKASDGTRYDWTHAYAMKESYFEARTAEEAIAYFNQRTAEVRTSALRLVALDGFGYAVNSRIIAARNCELEKQDES